MANPNQTRALADQLWQATLQQATSPLTTWKQEELLSLAIVHTVGELMPLLKHLMEAHKFQSVKAENDVVAFSVRTAAAASKFSSLKDETTRNIYRLIEDAGTAGMWKATLKKRLKLHENVVEKALKVLLSTKHIKQLKSARSSAKKTFLLYDLAPTKEVTGGGWFDEGEIDFEMVERASQLVVGFVRSHSWLEGPKLPKAPSKTGEKRKRAVDDEGKASAKKGKSEPQAVAGVKEYGADDDLEEKIVELRSRAATKNGRILVPYPSGYKEYPTCSAILDYIDESGVIEKDISIQDMQELLDHLVYDGQLEKMSVEHRKRRRLYKEEEKESVTIRGEDEEDEMGYRWIRRPDPEFNVIGEEGIQLPKSGFSETPCSRCPVFRLCADGGPVNPKNCEYLKEWF